MSTASRYQTDKGCHVYHVFVSYVQSGSSISCKNDCLTPPPRWTWSGRFPSKSEVVAFGSEVVAFGSEVVTFGSEVVTFGSEVVAFGSEVVSFGSENVHT